MSRRKDQRRIADVWPHEAIEPRAAQLEAATEAFEWEIVWEGSAGPWGFICPEITNSISPLFLLVAGVDANLLGYGSGETARRVT
jgi:hypothetical protein